MINRLLLIAWKEFIQIVRDRRMLAVVIVLPTLALLLFGYAISFDVKHVRLGVWDQNGSAASRDLVGDFTHNEYFDLVAEYHSDRECTAALDRGTARVVLVIPATYSQDLASNHTAVVQFLVDGSDSTTASTALGYIGAIATASSLNISAEALRRIGGMNVSAVLPVDNRIRYWYNEDLRSTSFLVPGLVAVILMMLSALLTSGTVVRERERGTLETLIVSPLQPVELILGKLLPYVCIAFADVLLILLVAALAFHIPMVGDPLYAIGLSTIFLIAALGIGLLISTLARAQQVAMMGAMIGTQLPTFLLSGFMFPISSMPPAVRAFTYLVPARYFISILRGVLMKGNGPADIWQPALLLLAISVAVLTLAVVRFRKKLE